MIAFYSNGKAGKGNNTLTYVYPSSSDKSISQDALHVKQKENVMRGRGVEAHGVLDRQGDDMPALKNAKQERFCQEYVIDNNATQAAIRAGYSEKWASVQASKLLNNPNIPVRAWKSWYGQ